ncbi:Carboxypeptidase cpdS [Talaromyces atroroseus]|uniref:Carboxypeptidase cpdS n=1 Tax=Talaromyces atroroseus TaxID=1441469 RepID=A0A225AS61_TALAT|nr:Carboxypeptidase cpdS [Talaromyces atroroseus]OKL62333.1 Carboxypeptidase cpdS [Talaromyces atroroseus]
MQGYKVYLTGESYVGQYIPYIEEGFINQNEITYFNLKGIQINDPSINEDAARIYSSAVAALDHFPSVFSLNDSFTKHIHATGNKCGYTDFLNKALTYPPPSNLPTVIDAYRHPDCLVWDEIVEAATLINPCFNIYHLTDFCPYLWDEIGFPSLGDGPNNYFNQSDVQQALHVPPTNYDVCDESNILPFGDSSVPSALGPLPKVTEATNNVIIWNGWYDYLLFMNGTLATIQNMTWNGAQGFQKPPIEDLFVPYTAGSSVDPVIWDGGAGILGKAHTERGLTFTSVYGSGHEIPQCPRRCVPSIGISAWSYQ